MLSAGHHQLVVEEHMSTGCARRSRESGLHKGLTKLLLLLGGAMLRCCLRVDVLRISPSWVTTDDGEMLGWCSVSVHCHLLRSTSHVQGQSNVDQCLCLEFPFCVLSDNDVDKEGKPHVSSLRPAAVTGKWSTKVGTLPGARHT